MMANGQETTIAEESKETLVASSRSTSSTSVDHDNRGRGKNRSRLGHRRASIALRRGSIPDSAPEVRREMEEIVTFVMTPNKNEKEEEKAGRKLQDSVKVHLFRLFKHNELAGREKSLDWVWAALLPSSVVIDIVAEEIGEDSGSHLPPIEFEAFRARIVVMALDLHWGRREGNRLDDSNPPAWENDAEKFGRGWATKLVWAADFGSPRVFVGLLGRMLTGNSNRGNLNVEGRVCKKVMNIIDEADELYWCDGIHLARNDRHPKEALRDLMLRAAFSGALSPEVHGQPAGERLHQNPESVLAGRGEDAPEAEGYQEGNPSKAVCELIRFLLERRWGNKTIQPDCEPIQLLVVEALGRGLHADRGLETWKVKDDIWWWDMDGIFQNRVHSHLCAKGDLPEEELNRRFEEEMKQGGLLVDLHKAMERRQKRFLLTLSFLLSWGCRLVYSGWTLSGVLESLNVSEEEITDCLLDAITMARNPFIPALTLSKDLSINQRFRSDHSILHNLQGAVTGMTDALLLELPRTRDQFEVSQQRGEDTVRVNTLQEMLEPEAPQELEVAGPKAYHYDNNTRSLLYDGPLLKALDSHKLEFLTSPLLVDYLSWRFSKRLPSPLDRGWRVPPNVLDPLYVLEADEGEDLDESIRCARRGEDTIRWKSGYAASQGNFAFKRVLRGAVEILEGSEASNNPSKVPKTIFPAMQFMMVGVLGRPEAFSNVPAVRFTLNFVNYVLLIFIFGASIVLEKPERIPWQECVLYAYIGGAIANEISELCSAYRRRRFYLRDQWNYFDLSMLTMVFVSFILRMVSLEGTLSGQNMWHLFNWSRILLSFSAPLLLTRALWFAQISLHLGPTVQVFFKMIVELVRFAVILVVVMIGFAMAFYALFSEKVRTSGGNRGSLVFEATSFTAPPPLFDTSAPTSSPTSTPTFSPLFFISPAPVTPAPSQQRTPGPSALRFTPSPVAVLQPEEIDHIAQDVAAEVEEALKESETQLFYEGFKDYKSSALTTFKALVGSFNFDDFEDVKYGGAGVFLLVVYLLVITITLLNLLIAVFSTAHANVTMKYVEEYHHTKAFITKTLAERVDEGYAPEPFNLLVLLIIMVWFMVQRCCPCLSQRQTPVKDVSNTGMREGASDVNAQLPLQTISPSKRTNVWKITCDQMAVVALCLIIGPPSLLGTSLLWLISTVWYLPFNLFETVFTRDPLKRSNWYQAKNAFWGLVLSLSVCPFLFAMSMVRVVASSWPRIRPPILGHDQLSTERPCADMRNHFKAKSMGETVSAQNIRRNMVRTASTQANENIMSTQGLVVSNAVEIADMKKLLVKNLRRLPSERSPFD